MSTAGEDLENKLKRRRASAAAQPVAESLKERMNRAREARENRRDRVLTAFRHFFDITAMYFNIDSPSVEEFVLDSSDYLDALESICQKDGTNIVVFFYQDAEPPNPLVVGRVLSNKQGGNLVKRVMVCSGKDVTAVGQCVYFIKLKMVELTAKNIGDDTFFGCMEISPTDPSGLLKAICLVLDNVFKNLLESSDKFGKLPDTPETQTRPEKKLLEYFTAFMSFLNSSEKNVAGQTKFKSDPKIAFLDTELTPDEIGVMTKNQQKLEAIESMVKVWYKQVEGTLAESQQIRREADDVGPLVEVEQWRDRAAKFVSILEQTKDRKVSQGLQVLTATNSKLMRSWKEIILKISEAANEALDNLKYLTSLEKYCMPIYSSSPIVLMETIPHLINAIRSVNSVSKYYFTPERMTSLFIKITNQMVTGCRRYITDNGKTKLWDIPHTELKRKFKMCLKVYEVYRLHLRRVREEMMNNPGEKQFDFSDMYIFAKFDAFCKRLQKLLGAVEDTDAFAALAKSSIEGTEHLLKRMNGDFKNFKSKSYDYIDPRRTEFEYDYEDFRKNIFLLEADLNKFMDDAIAKHTMSIEALKLLKRFEKLNLSCLNVRRKFDTILKLYENELQYVTTVYMSTKDDPLIPRGMPPVAGRIAWARQLFERCAAPVNYLEANYPEVFEIPFGIKVTKTYNRIAKALVQFEMNFHELWLQHVDLVRDGLSAPLLVVHPETKEILVNYDPFIPQSIQEASTLAKMDLEIPEIAKLVVYRQRKLYDTYIDLKVMVNEIQGLKNNIPPSFAGLMELSVKRLDAAILPGIKNMTWLSMSLSSFFDSCRQEMDKLNQILKNMYNIKSARIDDTLVKIATTIIPDLQDEPVTLEQFLETTQKRCEVCAFELENRTHKVEEAVNELISMFLTEANIPVVMVRGVPIWTIPATPYKEEPDPRERPTERELYLEHINEECRDVFNQFKSKHLEALVSCIKLSLDAIRKRVATANLTGTRQSQGKKKLSAKREKDIAEAVPLLSANIVLTIPNLVCQPSVDDMQQGMNKASQAILEVTKKVTQWGIQPPEKQQSSIVDTPEAAAQNKFKNNFYRLVLDNKDITKVIMSLSSVLTDLKGDVQDTIQNYLNYRFLWADNRDAKIQEFVAGDPLLVEYQEQIVFYEGQVQEIQAFPPSHRVGSIELRTGPIKLALSVEAKTWKIQIGKQLNYKYRQKMEEMAEFINDNMKRLQRPVKSLEDVRFAMQCLEDVREKHLYIDMMMTPVEEAYNLLQKFKLPIQKEEQEAVFTLRFQYTNLQELAKEVMENLVAIQPKFRQQLVKSVATFKTDVGDFENRYEEHGPMEPGIPAREASDRVTIFQAQFEDLNNKFETYAGGEELFGMAVNEYPIIHKVKKEMTLLQKLYGLYNLVMQSIEGYGDLLWSEVDIEKINAELADFQNKCKKMPKALKDWQAYADLKKKIDDFSETCPLLEMMANKAMKDRHWKRLENLMGYTFDVKAENFMLKNIVEAPLLKFHEDVEDICVSAVKEKDIEAKLKQVIAEWTVRNLVFTTFKTRGEIMLKTGDVSDIITQLEDSLMIMGTLLSNRYNTPFKKEIQLWVQKLSNTTDMLTEWLAVQNLWIYLEAVFVGGDIAKQLPKEAKRFQGIDKAWVKVMSRAHENSNVVQCCVGDETMNQLLPHLMEQLEACQKSLTGYLESKRLIFPRFFFISDPVLLEILGQASDSHAIQPHLLGIFENVATLEFHEKEYDKIVAYLSREKERIPMTKEVWARGNVEIWLGDLLREQQRSLGIVIKNAYQTIAAPGFELLQFLLSSAAQPGLLALQFLWTKDSEDAIKASKSDKKIMNTTNQKFLDILNSLIDQTTRDMDRFTRIKFETLITIHVHQRDIFDDLVRLKVKSINEFEWLKQSRFYYAEEENICWVKITDVDFIYQNEYLGCTDRLVITPLTDRCYITLAQAIIMSMGGAPAGPAGTGKTETVKDMGKALGKYVVVFNCSDQMDFRGLGRIFKGLAQSGSWGCFDEFNRIELPVLSVAAQQIHIVLMAKKEKKSVFIFSDGDVVDLNPEFGIFLTMNPGYAGRQELPENLKVLFRTVSMMVPDRQIIMRVKLASCGYIDNIILAQKFFVLYKLCEEQLTKQVHYDFGLRNILSVLRTLGSEKRSHPSDSETMVVMRILRDMNLSKLVDEDEPLFISLISDLFPGIHLDSATYPDLQMAITNQVELAGLINHPPWNLKLVQLFEQQRVRHGMMVLGPSGAGKTTCIHTLMKAMTETGRPHREMRMNPKAITAPQMFGRLDVATNDWTDGIFSTLWRRSLKCKPGEHIWIVLDGPVDAVWIENLNSVLDDNKTLTLANGDRIPMAPTCKIIFEPDNIDNASPATVSRNGMVFISSSFLDWKPILKGWLKTRPPFEADLIEECYNKMFNDLHTFVKNNLTPKMKVLECNYVRQSTDLLEGLFPEKEQSSPIPKSHVEKLFLLAMMWSVGALLELDDRYKIEQFMKRHPSKMELPKAKGEETIFEFVVDDAGKWEHWNNRVIEYIYPSDSIPEYTTILIPNVDNVRTTFLLNTIAKQAKAVLLIGEPGTAKTVMVKGYVGKYDPEEHISKLCNFSSATVPIMFQRTMESYIEKRMGSTYGPPGGRKMTVFIDDINMPVINEWGDQVCNEIVRQVMSVKGFYNLDRPGDFTHIMDVQYIAAMIHPGGGRNDIPPRLKRQFNIFNCTLPSNVSIDKIFGIIGCGYFCSSRFGDEIVSFLPKLIPATRILWQQTKIKLLPTPTKFHYIFNLRDLSRIWQGMLKIERLELPDVRTLLALWNHECTRTIADRFINSDDKKWFQESMFKVVSTNIGESYAAVMPEEPYFVDFLRDAPESTAAADEAEEEMAVPKIYEMLPSFEVLKERLEFYMAQHNESVRGGAMDLVFFRDCMIHLVKISRIIKSAFGHALLVGVGGSGKQSLNKLATYIAGYKLYQILLTKTYNANNLIDDLKFLYRVAGQKGQGITFIFTDNEIKDEGFLEYLNNVLSGGEVSVLFAKDEMEEILTDLTAVMKKEFPKRIPTADALNDYFSARCKSNLHVVLCFSPVGDKFRSRSFKFPGLISGCTIDWFSKWPTDALVAVAEYFLGSFEIVTSPEMKLGLINSTAAAHEIVEDVCNVYFQRFRRANFVTPKSYLSFLSMYKNVYTVKVSQIGELAYRMSTGLAKLLEATESVGLLSEELVEKEKELAVASIKVDKVLEEVTRSAEAATVVKNEVQKVKDKAQKIVDGIAIEKAIAEAKLEEARPAMKAAEEALQTIKAADISLVRKLGKPPHLIMRIMDVVLILFQKRLDSVVPDPDKPCPKPSWGESLKLMSGAGFLFQLQNFPKDTINEETIELMAPYIEMPDYNYESAVKTAGAVAGLLSWTVAMVMFYGINREVLPLKANLIVQEARLTVALGELNEAQAQLDEKQRELDIVQAVYDGAMSEKMRLVNDAESCRFKMSAASALINGLAGERARWTEQSKLFKSMIDRCIGDVLILSGFISYAGPFNSEFRNMYLLKAWQTDLTNRKVYYSGDLNVVSSLTDPATIGEWNIQGLPTDDLSIQNGIIVTRSSRYPLLIDPQGQGKMWVRNREKDNDLMVTTLNHRYFRTHVEDALAAGRPLLIEDVGEQLDPALDNILDKNFMKSGRGFKVKLGDKECDVSSGFSLVITTKLPNPTYTPEISAKTSIIDFTVTMKGLEDQLLGRVILTEKMELEIEKKKLLETVTSYKRRMQELEDNLLYKLTSTKGSLVEDESLLVVLAITKDTAAEVKEKLVVAAETEIRINASREEFRPVAARGSTLYFLICEMSLVNYMYQTSLKQFLQIFDRSMARSQKSPHAAKRIVIIIEFLTYEVHKYTSRGLYGHDKFLFVLQLALKIDMAKGFVKHEEFQNLLKGGAALDLNAVAPKPAKWITDMTWLNLVELSKLPQFREIQSQVTRGEKIWKMWFDKDAPEEEVIPDGYSTSLDNFHKLLLIRSWCPDRTLSQARKYLADSLGQRFADPVILSFEHTFLESDTMSPFIGLLSMGGDPTQEIQDLSKKFNTTCESVSMGQGQEIHARRLVNHCMSVGGWALLQNCHLGLEFVDELLDILNAADPAAVNPDFRVWITTEPHPAFSIGLLQCSIKFTNQPPEGMRAGLLRTFSSITQEHLEYTEAYQWRPMLYAVGFLHSCLQERRKFGPLGWNIPYEFNTADYSASVQFVMNHLDDMDPKKGVSWVTVRYMLAEVQYGGRVTDDFDKRLLSTFAKVWFGDFMFADTFTFYGEYKIPKGTTIIEYLNAISALPAVDTPLVFGLHPNADITYQSTYAQMILETIMNIQPKETAAGGGESRESVVYKMADEMLDKMPPNYVPHEVRARLEKMGILNPLNIILKQEVDRMQNCINIVRTTLFDLKLAIEGTIIMNENLRDALDKIYDARVPVFWKKVSWDSTTIGFWFTELLERNEQFYRWCFSGRPFCFWLTGFFNPQGFLTAMRQEVTRSHKGWALDMVSLCTDVSKNFREDITSGPPEGILVYGLYLDGAGWDRKMSRLMEQAPKVLAVPLPVMHIYALNTVAPKDPRLYLCPLYKKPQRTDLNFVTPTWLKTNVSPDHWILRAVALLCDIK